MCCHWVTDGCRQVAVFVSWWSGTFECHRGVGGVFSVVVDAGWYVTAHSRWIHRKGRLEPGSTATQQACCLDVSDLLPQNPEI